MLISKRSTLHFVCHNKLKLLKLIKISFLPWKVFFNENLSKYHSIEEILSLWDFGTIWQMTEHHSSLYFVLFGLGFISLFLSRTPCWNIMKSEWFADNADNYCWRNTYFRYRSSVMKVGFPSCRLLNALSEYLFTSTSLSQLTQNQMLPKYTEVHIQDWFMESRLHVIIVLSNFRFWLLIFFLNLQSKKTVRSVRTMKRWWWRCCWWRRRGLQIIAAYPQVGSHHILDDPIHQVPVLLPVDHDTAPWWRHDDSWMV